MLEQRGGGALDGAVSDARDWPTLSLLHKAYVRPKRLTKEEIAAAAKAEALRLKRLAATKKKKGGRSTSRNSRRTGRSTSRSTSRSSSRSTTRKPSAR